MAAESTASVSDQLTTAKQELTKMRVRYKDKHPKVRAQLRKIEQLERQAAAQQEEPAELRAARAELDQLRERYERQIRKVAELERRLNASADLQAARERFAKAQRIYRERHPKYQEALQRLQELEREQPGI